MLQVTWRSLQSVTSTWVAVRDKYVGNDQIHTGSGKGMKIKYIDYSTVSTPVPDLHLKNILYLPKAAKNLVSVHRLAKNNFTFLEFHPDYFLVKDQATKNIILK